MTGAQHIRNLLSVYEWGREEDRADAIQSYWRYHSLICGIANETGHGVKVAAGVFSALSPNNNYVSNLKNCRTLLKAEKAGKTIEDFRVNTYDSNKRKAWSMARGGVDPLELFRGLKTKAFFLNCLEPNNPDHITVDGHMYWVWMGRKGAVKTRGIEGLHGRRPVKAPRPQGFSGDAMLFEVAASEPKAKPERKMRSRKEDAPPHLAPKMYHEIADGIRLVPELKGVIPNQAQAVLWQNWRRMHNVLGSSQIEFLQKDVYAIGGDDTHQHGTKGCGQ